MSQFLSYNQALSELKLNKKDLNDLVAKGELRAFHEGDEIRFKKDDIVALKKSRETEPTIVLADTHAGSPTARSSAEPIDLDRISTEETVLNIEGLLEDESEGTTPIPGSERLGEPGLGEDTVLDTEGLELDADFDLGKDDTLLADDEPTAAGAAGGRQVQMIRKQSHALMTALLALSALLLVLPSAILMNLLFGSGGTFPSWVDDYLSFLNPVIEGIVKLF